ncbi:hypothetical protein HELRODRAFT_142940, partial [Helobdella robusta]|uniref:Ig-like domain-containing protein n=1 Tax=Helobdella robusta TaxID=6412 RepID=T1EJ82_HELRO
GDTQNFECKVIGYPIPTIKWYKDDMEIANDSRYEVDFDVNRGVVTLSIKNLTLADEGLYQCRAENSEGLASTMTYLAVKTPRITYENSFNKVQSVRIGGTLSLEVNISGCPKSTVSWFCGVKKLLTNSRIAMENAGNWNYLKVRCLQEEDAGLYKVHAENIAGQDTA